MSVVVAGAGGFIGGHLVAELRRRRVEELRAVDIEPVSAWHQRFDDVENEVRDLRDIGACRQVCDGAHSVYNLACNMGGMGFIESNRAECMLNVLINTHMLLAASEAGVERYFFASSACVYNAEKQSRPDVVPLQEADAYPAMPEDGYGWEKLFGERMCRHFSEDFGLQTRVARLHNVYGPYGTWRGGREKAPAAICRKVIDAVHRGTGRIEIWGDGRQTRSFTWIGDAIHGIARMMELDIPEPLNLGSSEMVTIDQLVDIVEAIAGVSLERSYRRDAPLGVSGRNSDNALIRKYMDGWEPRTPLREGLVETYRWIEKEYLASQD
jgi:nucleoside-diphosphate-sugar epimerase